MLPWYVLLFVGAVDMGTLPLRADLGAERRSAPAQSTVPPVRPTCPDNTRCATTPFLATGRPSHRSVNHYYVQCLARHSYRDPFCQRHLMDCRMFRSPWAYVSARPRRNQRGSFLGQYTATLHGLHEGSKLTLANTKKRCQRGTMLLESVPTGIPAIFITVSVFEVSMTMCSLPHDGGNRPGWRPLYRHPWADLQPKTEIPVQLLAGNIATSMQSTGVGLDPSKIECQSHRRDKYR